MSGFNYSEHVKLEDLLKDEEEYFRILRADAEDTSEQAELYRESGTDSAPSVPLFTLKEYAYTASWSWEATSDTCAICRESLMAQCIQCQAVDSSKNTCKLAWGECNHGFHAHCLNKWLSGDRNTCPLDNLPWKYKENK